jgi:uncharacterized protein (TIGR03118 family)
MTMYKRILSLLPIAGLVAVLGLSSCKSDTTEPSAVPGYTVTNLVANNSSYSGARVDQKLINAWGMAVSGNGNFWISAADGNVSTIYDGTGAEKLSAVTIPSRDSVAGGNPTGQVYNPVPGNFKGALFIFVTEDGTVASWKSADGGAAEKAAMSATDQASYKGCALADDGGTTYLYVADFKGRKIDVYDRNFAPVLGKSFADPTIPLEYSPFNIVNIGGKLYIAYAKRDNPPNDDEEVKGDGNGYVSVFNPDGSFVSRFASQGTLNAPWGIAQAPSTFGTYQNAILVGNFGDGRISAFNATSGAYIGQLKGTDSKEISIDGLWGLGFSSAGSNDGSLLYFTAGPKDEADGLFGYVKFITP